jgi:hypothetical protein
MKTGTKSVLFGVHQCIWHPLTVALAWRKLYGVWPTWKEMLCIAVHDLGYWGCTEMDGDDGGRHPETGAAVAKRLLGPEYEELCLAHSRHYARDKGIAPSRLCWADKYSIVFDPWWLYLPRAWATGELAEYRRSAAAWVPADLSDRAWHAWCVAIMSKVALLENAEAFDYINKQRLID